ncbi:hypothetical protein ACLOJK_041496 [Asimina triloba]
MTESGSSSGDWLHFYHPQASGGRQAAHPNAPPSFGRAPMVVDATVTTTAAATAPSRNIGPSNEGRAGRPARRRSRASRRAPTTLLNTDTTNFRAMVQQFTGAPPGPFLPTVGGHAGGGPTLNFELGGHDRRQGMAGAAARPYYHLQHHQYSYHQLQQQQEAAAARGGEEVMYSVAPPGGDAFLRGGFGNARAEVDVSQGFLEGFTAQLVPRRPQQQQPQPSTESDTSAYLM